jgi:hypothetical protein
MPRYRVAICFEEAVVIEVDADSEDHAEELAHEIAEQHAGSEYPPEYNADTVHRDYFSQDAKEITND